MIELPLILLIEMKSDSMMVPALMDYGAVGKKRAMRPLVQAAAAGSSATSRIEAVKVSIWKCGFKKHVAL